MRVKYLIPFLVLVLIFGFAPACSRIPTETKKVEEVEEVIEEVIEESTEEEIVEERVAEEEIVEEPTEEIEPEPEPIILSGSGDSIIDIEKSNISMVVHIIGNSSSSHFAVTSYNKNGERIELLVNTTEPYNGIRPLDLMSGEWTSRFEISASGDWIIEVLPLSSLRVLFVPGSIEGKDDEVFIVTGGIPDLAKINGNNSSNYFGVLAYNGGRDLLVNTTDPYDGTVMLNNKTIIIEVIAIDGWSIEINEK